MGGYNVYRNESTNRTEFGPDGFMRAYGDASAYDDMQGELVGRRLTVPGSKITQNDAEITITFNTNCAITDYVSMSIQMPHSRKPDTYVMPHVHWVQASSNTPNWYLRYRWQPNGEAWSTTWVNCPKTTNVFTYSTGSLHQITPFNPIFSSDNSISDIIQFRLTRDSNNTSLLFVTTDPYSGTVDASYFDVHFQKDTIGSNTEYDKY